jgi:hypothetical protein
MIKYAKVIDNDLGLCEVGLGTNTEFYKSIGMVELDVEQSEKDNSWYLSEKCPHYTPEEKEAIERARLDALYMTRSDFFDGMIMAFGLDSKELRTIVENVLGSINITPIQIRVALNNYDNALNFYRKHTLFELINNVKIPVNETTYLLFTPEIWDGFFNTKDYHQLLQAIHEVENENTTNEQSEL